MSEQQVNGEWKCSIVRNASTMLIRSEFHAVLVVFEKNGTILLGADIANSLLGYANVFFFFVSFSSHQY